MARIISISNHKGGVGKTTMTANLGFAFARQFKVLLIDMDPQANLSMGLGYADCDENIGSYIRDVIHFRNLNIRPKIINEYVHIIPGDFNLQKQETLLHETMRGEMLLEEITKRLKSLYDLILIDCPPAFNLLTINALKCSSLVLIPAKPEVFSIKGVDVVIKFANENNTPYKIIFNQVDRRTLFHKKVIEESRKKYNSQLINHTVRNNIALAETFSHAQDIFNYKNESIGAMDFVNLADELVQYI
ncbi:MAG: ParA family protein [Cyclobacteriaceae bacterium]|nr:ParA family protein [Cyclobacteriaceae bacterium]